MPQREIRIAIGTMSALKVSSIENAFKTLLPDVKIEISTVECDSLVPETPHEDETKQGAINRAESCLNQEPGSDYYIGIESGLVSRYGDTYEESWACIIDKQNNKYLGYSSGLKIPGLVGDLMTKSSLTHADAMRQLQKEHALLPGDTWGNYTENTLSRSNSIHEAVRNALIQDIAPSESLFKQTER